MADRTGKDGSNMSIPCEICGGQPCREGCATRHTVDFDPNHIRGKHDVECDCGWWADAPAVMLMHYVGHHLGEQHACCERECCEVSA